MKVLTPLLWEIKKKKKTVKILIIFFLNGLLSIALILEIHTFFTFMVSDYYKWKKVILMVSLDKN